ncbi:hypothetical protein M4951_01065 [Blastopirellula sp. J2-11]|uniref:hypothetical protein n=1 Tax=Blastopirellula sp. J2-11 TaxID=2943192 RepID=UPI0021C740D8|nr:hypothetical protein [Blastopirellula sp. J2-11]UUO06918.1 hypothetical protein M4951_01065 [Blastopirellula sp. J2-11]
MNNKSILPAIWDVPDVFRRRLGDQAGRQRVMQADGHLLIVLHQPPKPGEKIRIGRYFWRDAKGEWNSSDLGSGDGVLVRHLGQYAAAIDRLEKREEAAEGSAAYFQVISDLSPLLRATRNLQAVLQQAREMGDNHKVLINARDQAYELERKAELLYNEAKNELDFAIAQQTERQAESSHRMSISAHRLNVLAAFFFPIVTLATIFGADLHHGFEDWNAPWPFLAMTGMGLLLGLLLWAFVSSPIESAKRVQRDHSEARPPRDPGR